MVRTIPTVISKIRLSVIRLVVALQQPDRNCPYSIIRSPLCSYQLLTTDTGGSHGYK